MASKDFYTVDEVAALLRMQVSAVRNRLSRRDPTLPPSLLAGGRRLFPVAAYEVWKGQLLMPASVTLAAPTEQRRGRPRQASRGLA